MRIASNQLPIAFGSIARKSRLSRAIVAWTLVASPSVGVAQDLHRASLHIEGTAGTMLSEYQQNTQTDAYLGNAFGYGLGLHASIRADYDLWRALSPQFSITNSFFPSSLVTMGHNIGFYAGLRYAPWLSSLGRAFVDANGGLAHTGGKSRFGFELGAGYEFSIYRDAYGIGPVVRYAQVMQSNDDPFPEDARFWSAGLSIAFRVAREDRDEDGIEDDDDRCPTEPKGEHADPMRLGCPLYDADGDGVFDRDDACPTVKAGATPDPARPGCPKGDDDEDGISNAEDVCPTAHRGPFPDPAPERRGCPTPDRDGDAVPDAIDTCPGDAGAPHVDPMRNGCPGLVRIDGSQLRILRPVYFATNEDVVLPTSFAVLEAVADALRAIPAIRTMRIAGHTDDVGQDAYNLELSRRRASSVVRWLVEHGIDGSRLSFEGYGESRPIVDGASEEARAANRRVEFHIVAFE